MAFTGFRFDHDQAAKGDIVHCFRTLEGLKSFVAMMKGQDPEFGRMRYWKVEGRFAGHDEGDVRIFVESAVEIRNI